MLALVLALALVVAGQAQQAGRPDVTAHAREVIASLTAKDFAAIEAQFTDAMKAALPAGRLEATWTALLSQVGALKSCGANPRVRTISDKQMVITGCEFERASIDVQVAFDTDGRISGLALRPAASAAVPYTLPPYATERSYVEQDVTVGGPDWALPGTLTLPAGAGPFAAVVLVQGSGPNDRDETVGANKPFKDLALGLASRGIAVLRYDKRSKVYGARMAALPSMTVKDEVIDDAGAALALLRAQPKIDSSRVFVLGHSLGGMLIPRIVAANPAFAGAVVMAGAARPLEDAIVEQSRYLAMADGTISPEEQAQIDAVSKTSAAVKALTPADAASGRAISGAPAAYWLDLRGYDPPSAAAGLKTRLLILQGERDYQVTMAEFGRWRSALGSRANVTFHSYPALNHLFMAGTGASLPAEYQIPSHVSADVIRDIVEWIGKR